MGNEPVVASLDVKSSKVTMAEALADGFFNDPANLEKLDYFAIVYSDGTRKVVIDRTH